MQFDDLGLLEPLLRAVQAEGYASPTAIQENAIPHILKGHDLLGCAQTGTGKTAAFALPILQRLHDHAGTRHGGGADHHRQIRALVLTPTRELAAQIGESFRVYGRHMGLRHTVIFGGVKQGSQVRALRGGVDIIVATPGRLLDLLEQRQLTISHIKIFVLDEADRMLDMGFIHDVRRVIAQLPARRQTLMFSATMPDEIQGLADTILHKPVEVRVSAESPAPDTVQQAIYFVEPGTKTALLEHLLIDGQMTRTLVFTRTKRGADRVARRLAHGGIIVGVIHANKSQNTRLRALADFKSGAVRVLVASDIAARGLDVDDISHVVNYDMPGDSETYVHRIGRTGRAGAIGDAITFCSGDQRGELRDIEKLLGKSIPVLHHSIKPPAKAAGDEQEAHGSQAPRRSRRGGGQGGGNKPGHTGHGSDHKTGGGSHKTANATGGEHTARASHKGASPEQQKDHFWRNRKSSSRRISAKPRRRRGRRG
jgi:ATP-dependent RNA helicase RhlE